MTDRQSRWAVVTGASSGIGEATALAVAHEGWNVVVHYFRGKLAADNIAEQIRNAGRRALVLQADIGDAHAVLKLVDESWGATGGIDAWVHLAGADLLTGTDAQLAFEAKLDVAVRVDLAGTVLTCRAIGKRMVKSGRGAIVTVGWDQAATGMEGDSGELFAAVKGGVMAFSRSLAKTLAPHVRVNCVAPGWIQTKWGKQASQKWQDRVRRETLLGRWGRPADVANCIAFLVSDDASFITGQTIAVNGGAVAM